MSTLDALYSRGKEFLGVEVPILGGAMSWISESNLVAAISNSGAFGVLATGAMTGPLLLKEILATKEKTNKPFGVNIIIMNPHLEDLLDICINEKISHVILAGGLASAKSIEKLKQYGIKSIAFAPSFVVAKRLIRNGISGLIIEGLEAGGHIGPVSTTVLAQEILPNVTEVPVFVAGGIGRGETMVNYLHLGAAGVQMGTIFVCSDECIAHPSFKKAFINAGAKDAQITVQIDPDFPVIPVRAISNQGSINFILFQQEVVNKFKNGEYNSKQEAQLEIEHYWAGALRRAVIEGDVVEGSLMAGQIVGLVNEILPVQTIINNCLNQARDYLKS
ncbi:Nitronate monooxygenase [Candidatus Hepatincolaceae symbiont of Richtersius coronifer]